VYGINGFSFALTFFTSTFFINYREDMASPPPTRKSPRKPHPIPPPFDPSLPNLQPLNLFRIVPLLSVEPNDEVPETPPPSMADQCDAIHVEVMQKTSREHLLARSSPASRESSLLTASIESDVFLSDDQTPPALGRLKKKTAHKPKHTPVYKKAFDWSTLDWRKLPGYQHHFQFILIITFTNYNNTT
jgi:hypothetical protein